MEQNTQAPLPRAVSDGSKLDIFDIFPTVQGEGTMQGVPAIFIRLSGCNLQCPLCDTEYTDGAENMALAEVLRVVSEYWKENSAVKLAVLTGGEPFRQNIFPLIMGLLELGLIVQVESNGKLDPIIPDGANLAVLVRRGQLHITLAPKTARISEMLEKLANCYKYPVSAAEPLLDDGIPRRVLDHPLPVGAKVSRPRSDYKGPVYLFPEDTGSTAELDKSTNMIIEAVLSRRKYMLLAGIQAHKIWGVG